MSNEQGADNKEKGAKLYLKFMKNWFIFIIVVMIGLLASCPNSGGKQPVDPENPNNKTFIVFDNTQGICAVSVYDDYRRRDEDKIADIPAGNNSGKIAWTPGDSVPFYFLYRVTIKGINNFSLNYVPEIGRDQKQVRIDADVTTNIKVPTLSETISSPDKLLSNDSYLLIQNNSSYPFRLNRGESPISSDNLPASLVNSGEKAQYTINPGPASPYQLMVGADYKKFPGSIVNFEAGHIYYFEFYGTISLVRDIELKLENVNGFVIPKPPATPVVIVSNGSLALQWTAVESATAYEIWLSTVNDYTSALKYGTDITASLTAVISGLNNGTAYYIWLKAKNNLGTSGFSPVATGTPSASTVKPPDPMIAPSIIAGNGQLSVSWQAVEDTSVYEVWAGTTNDIQTAIKQGEDVSGLSTVISGLNNGTNYYVWIKAKNNIGVSGFSPPATGKPLGTPGTPILSSGSDQLLVTWTVVAGADEYEVYYGIGTPTTLAVTTAETTATITGLTNGTSYYVRLRAKNVSGISDYGSSVSGVPIGNMGVVTVSSGDGQLSLSWAAVAGANQYEVYYNTTNSIPSNPTQTISTTTAIISGLTNGTTYYVWVKPKNANGSGNTSTAVSGKPLGTPEAPIVSPAYKGLLVTWTAVAGADEYEVYYGTDTPTTLAKTITGTTTTISGLICGTTYYICLRVKNSSGVSDYGPNASGVPNTIVPVPGLYRGAEKIGTQNLTNSLTYISSNAVSGDEYYIVLGTNESVSPKTLSYSSKTVGITLLGYGGERTITLNANGSMFTVNSGVTFTLDENITLIGRSTNNASLVNVSGGNLIMNNGAKITRNYSDNSSGGGIYISSGTITMNGGEIASNTTSSSYNGGGVYMSNGTFTMNGGEIIGNTAGLGGGVCLSSSGTFIMNGGKISRNSTSNSGGGIYINSGTVTINGGTISGNISSGSGGGILMYDGTLIMYGGIISGNAANHGGGGGIFVNFRTINGVFKKLLPDGGQDSGIIYGSEPVGVDADGIQLKNTSIYAEGHAVCNFTSPKQYRNTTAVETDQIDTSTGKGLSVNGNPPYRE